MPKFYHSSYSSSSKSPDNSPLADQKNDSFLDPSDIKSEPYDPEDDAIDVEDNVVNFTDEEMQDDEMYFPNPIVTYREPNSNANKSEFKKISLVAQPIIVSEKSNLEIIDMSKNGGKIAERKSAPILDPLDSGLEIIDTTNNKVVSDPLKIAAIQGRTEEARNITISNIRTVEKSDGESPKNITGDSDENTKTDELDNETTDKNNENEQNVNDKSETRDNDVEENDES